MGLAIERSKIVVAGGGPAALEALLTLAERLPAGTRRLVLLAPNRALTYRPLSAVAELATHPPHELALADPVADVDGELIVDGLAVVDAPRRRLLTRDGEWVEFDHLLLAVGAAALPPPPAWLPWPSEGDPGVLYGLLAAIGSGAFQRIAIVVPETNGWPLAGYELAVILAVAANATGSPSRITLIAEAERPLAPLGPEAEAQAAAELERAGIEIAAGSPARPHVPPPPEIVEDWYPALLRRLLAPRAPRTRARQVAIGDRLREFDLVITLPRSHGPAISGLPVDEHEFIVVDDRCRTPAERVWAAGDCTTLPLKHSTLAVAQADVAADAIAAELGARIEDPAPPPALTGVLLSGAAERWWEENDDLPEGLEPATHCLWWPPGRVLGGRLAHYVARRDPTARPLLLGHPHGTAIHLEPPPGPRPDGMRPAPLVDEETLERDAVRRRAYALRRIEHEAEELLDELGEERDEDLRQSREVLAHLNAAGYVVKDGPR